MKKRYDFGKVGVLAGGPSSEREISLRSGRAVYQALVRKGVDAILVEMRDNINEVVREFKFDVAFIALHGRFGEDGTVQKALEEVGIPYTGSGPQPSLNCLDKIEAKKIFVGSCIPTPQFMVFEEGLTRIGDIASFGFPLVIKPRFEGSSIGLGIVRSEDGLRGAVDHALKFDRILLVEEYIDGRELTVSVLDERALPVVEIVPKHKVYDYSAKYSDPDTKYLVPAPLSGDIALRAQELALRAHFCLGCKALSRVDMMLDKRGELFVLEVNTIPGMTERSLLPKAAVVSGIDFGQLCVKLVDMALKDGR